MMLKKQGICVMKLELMVKFECENVHNVDNVNNSPKCCENENNIDNGSVKRSKDDNNELHKPTYASVTYYSKK